MNIKTNEIEEIEHLCSSCQPGSDIPHEILSTRFRIANLCCAGEERIIRSSLEEIIGIEDISINIIGRYAIIKHCGVACCAPAEKIADILNDKQLGASIQEANADDVTEPDNPKYFDIFHGLLVLLFFIAAIIIDGTIEHHAYYFIGYLVCTAVGLIPILYDSLIAIYRKTVDIHILMTVAIIGAIASTEYLDAALVVTLFVLAEVMEGEIMRRVRNAVQLGVGAMPKNAILLNGDSIPVDDLKIGDKIAVRAGDMVLVDGIVTNGSGVIDESALTGEAIPIQKTKGSPVISGTVVQNGYLEVEVTTDPKESTVRKLNDKVAEVQADRGEFAKLVDKFAGGWTPFILLAAIILVVGGGGATGDWNKWLQRALVLLVLACPCAIVIAAPIPSVCTIALAAKHGVLIKGSTVVENLGLVNTLAVDKTGTLTKGFFSVSEKRDVSRVDCDEEDDDEEYLDPIGLAAALESKSSHPLANAVVSAYCGCIAEFQGKLADVKKVSVIDGIGMQGWVQSGDDWKHIAVGNERLLKAHGGKLKPSKKMQLEIDDFLNKHEGEVILYVVIEDEIKGFISLSDEIRPDAQEMVQRMHNNNFQVAMLTGDHKEVAEEICRTVSIPSHDCHSRLLPNDKLEWIIKKQKESKCDGVMMLGDGINDATALAAARVGVAMGAGGSAMAVVAADVVILSNNLLRIPSSVKLCRIARSTIIQNCSFAIGIKLLAIILAILGMLKLWHAVLIDVGSLLFVVANGSSILLKSYVFDEFKSTNDHHSHENCGHGDHNHSHEQDHSHNNTHDHDHDHSHDHSHDHEHSHQHDHEHDHNHNCGGEIELLDKYSSPV